MPQLIVKTDYLGKYQSKTENTFSDTPIIVDAMKFTPLDLLASAYNSCMLGTMEHIAKQNKFEIGEIITGCPMHKEYIGKKGDKCPKCNYNEMIPITWSMEGIDTVRVTTLSDYNPPQN